MKCAHCGAQLVKRPTVLRCIFCGQRIAGRAVVSIAADPLPREPMTPKAFEAWCKRVAGTYARAAYLLGMSRSGVVKIAYGECAPDMRTTLACFALERLGLE